MQYIYVQYVLLHSLSHNLISITGAISLFDKITQNVTLQILSMLECGLGDEGARAIANMLKTNSGLNYLE